MNAKEIINELLARFPEPDCREQEVAVENAKAFLKQQSHDLPQMWLPKTQEAIKDCFQAGLHYKVKAGEMNSMEFKLALAIKDSERMDWLDRNMMSNDAQMTFGYDVEIGKLREAIDEQISKGIDVNNESHR